MKNLILALFSISALFAVGHAISCYSCTYTDNDGTKSGEEKCWDGDSSVTTLSSVGGTSCTNCAKLMIDEDNFKHVRRTCETSSATCGSTYTLDGKTASWTCCTTEKCNGADSLRVTGVMLVSIALAALFLKN